MQSMSSRRQLKKIVILGSSGSIGENALRVAEAFPDRFQVVGLAVNSRIELLVRQARRFKVQRVAVTDEGAARRCRELAPEIQVLSGPEGLERLAGSGEADIVLAAVVGIAGLKPVLAALERGTDVALATKEALVVAGAAVMEAAARSGARLIPVDSEHSAIRQCLEGKRPGDIRKIILTASGGPFAGRPDFDLEKATIGDAMSHPTWSMGSKITVDSATMMNKGLELMEAHWLFSVPIEQIDILVHPESIVHSLVEFVDGTMLAQLSCSDMRIAIQYALTCPERVDGNLPALDLARFETLRFSRPDEKRFPCLRLARSAAVRGGTMPAVLNAANETAVREFLKGNLSFPGIARVVEEVMAAHDPLPVADIESVLEADGWAGEEAMRMIDGNSKGRR